jgi:hypothetical protein
VVGPASKQRIRATLRAALNKAVKERRIDINVAAEFDNQPFRPGRMMEKGRGGRGHQDGRTHHQTGRMRRCTEGGVLV